MERLSTERPMPIETKETPPDWLPDQVFAVRVSLSSLQAPPTDLARAVQVGGRLYVAGDHRDTATLDGALKSGRRAAEALLVSLFLNRVLCCWWQPVGELAATVGTNLCLVPKGCKPMTLLLMPESEDMPSKWEGHSSATCSAGRHCTGNFS